MAKKTLTKDEVNRILVTQGWFHGLNTLLRDIELGTQNPDKAAKIKTELFGLIFWKVEEAKAELNHLQAVVRRLEATCRHGMIPNPSQANNAYDSTYIRLRDDVRALDGWSISLLESSISILAAAENPATAGARVKGLKESFANLWNLRIEGWHAMKRFPEQFDLSIVLDE